MKKEIAIGLMILCLICVTGSMAEESGILLYAMSAGNTETEWGDTVTLADLLTFRVPADWVKAGEDPKAEGVGYIGSDTEGNSIAILSMRGETAFGSFQLLKKQLEEVGTGYTETNFHGIDMLIAQGINDGVVLEGLACIKDDGTPLIIGFQTVSGDVMQSDKLKKDVTAIISSIQALDTSKLLSFGDTLPDDAAMEEVQAAKTPEPTNTPAPKATPVIPEGSEQNDEINAACQETLEEFLYLWNIRSLDRMLEYCSAGWKAQQSNPMLRLFAVLGARNPLSYTLYEIRLEQDDAYADLVILMDRNNGKDPVNYRFSIHLVREDGWYIDPESLENYTKAEE